MSGQRPVLVTGSAGFIGSCLVRRLRSLGRDVTCMDIAGQGSESGESTGAEMGGGARGDVRSIDAIRARMPEGAEVYHLASVVGVAHVLRSPHATWSTCVRGTAAICEVAREKGARVLLTSSSEVYGEGSGRMLSERDPLPRSYGTWPRASYPEGKRAAECIMAAFVEEGGDGRVARLFNVSGPGQGAEGGMLVPTVVDALLRSKAVPIVGDGSDVRCFQHVDDAVDGLLRLMALERAPRGACNIGSGHARTVLELAERAASVLGRSFVPRFVTSRERYGACATRCRARVPNLQKSASLLGHRALRGIDRIVLDLAHELGSALDTASHEAVWSAKASEALEIQRALPSSQEAAKSSKAGSQSCVASSADPRS